MVLLIDILKRIFLNKYALLVGLGIAIFATGYLKGRASVIDKQSNQAVKDIIESEVIQDKLEGDHDKRIIKILTDPVDAISYSRQLSNFPDQETAPK